MIVTAIRNVRSLETDPPSYIVEVDVDSGDGVETFTRYAAIPGGGGLCDAILAAIAEDDFEGEITSFVPTPEEPFSGVYSKARLIAALSPTEFITFMTALDALDPQPRQIYEQAAELERDSNGLFDGMIAAMIAAWGDERVGQIMTAAQK